MNTKTATNCNKKAACNKQRSGALHLTQKVDYGITLLACLGKNSHKHSIKKIATETNLSFLFLQKIARSLQQAGIIKAERGKYGGYTLSKTPDELTLKDIIEALEGPIALVPCLKSNDPHICKHFSYCVTRPTFEKINNELQEHLLKKTLTTFIPCS